MVLDFLSGLESSGNSIGVCDIRFPVWLGE